MQYLLLHRNLTIVALLSILAVGGCASFENTAFGSEGSSENSMGDEIRVTNSSLSLDDYIRRLSGVYIDNSRDGVLVRGVNSLRGEVRALFVIDGVRSGRSLSEIRSRVNMNEVATIKIIKGDAASIYGVEGGNGVIEINF